MKAVKRQLREIQTHFPALPALKFTGYNTLTRLLGWRMDRDFQLLRQLRPFRLAVDVGGNWGQSIEAMMRTANPDRIVSFEPSKLLADRLMAAFHRRGKVDIEACALGETRGTMLLHTPIYRRFAFDGLASIDRSEAAGWLNPETMARFDPNRLSIVSDPVPVRRLDDFGLRPDLVKIDVQGAEYDVVMGGIETFRVCRPVSIVEAPSTRLVALFGDIGMGAFEFDGRAPVPHRGRWKNTIFLTAEHLERFRSAQPSKPN